MILAGIATIKIMLASIAALRVVETYVVAEEALEEVRLLGGDMISPLYFLPLEGDRC